MSDSAQDPSIEALRTVLGRVDAGLDHFAVLGVPRGASEQDVQVAFVQWAKLLHPDLPQLRGDLRIEATRAFQALTRARLVLTDPERRFDYISQGPSDSSMLLPKEPNPELARIHMHRARQQLIRRDWPAAELTLRQAMALFGEPQDAECVSELAWATFNNPDNHELERATEARHLLDRALGLKASAQTLAQAHYYLAIWSKMQGEIPQVKVHLDKCLSLFPKHVEAAREMRLYERRRSNSPPAPAPSSKVSRISASARKPSSTAIPVTSASGTETKKVKLEKKPSLLERIFGKR